MLRDDGGSPPRPRLPVRRWLGVALRALHLVAIVALGIVLIGRDATLGVRDAGLIVIASGGALWVSDIRANPAHLRQWAGMSMALKLIPVAAMVLWPAWAASLFWLVVVWSAAFSHAPASFRNAPLVTRRPPP